MIKKKKDEKKEKKERNNLTKSHDPAKENNFNLQRPVIKST